MDTDINHLRNKLTIQTIAIHTQALMEDQSVTEAQRCRAVFRLCCLLPSWDEVQCLVAGFPWERSRGCQERGGGCKFAYS